MKKILNNNAFTLMELLIVVAIIGILVSIAVPKYSDYRKRAFDARALSDLRNVASAEEVYFMDNEKYQSCSDNACASLPGISTLSKGTTISITARDLYFSGQASNKSGSGKIFLWDSEKGGLQ